MTPGLPTILPSHALLSVAEMYAADRAAQAAGVSVFDLMAAAGASVAQVVRARWSARPVAVLCGPANNGGDGFVVARLLSDAGWEVRLALLGSSASKGSAAAHAALWSGPVLPVAVDVLAGTPLVVDAIFGAGLSRGLDGAARTVVERINAENLTCVAVDVPSGLDGDTGLPLPGGDGREALAPRCAATVTFFRPKPAHLLFPGRALCGDLTVSDIGISAAVLETIAPRTAHNRPGLWALRSPVWNDHKYTRGHAVVVGGPLMTGAARLAARAARRAGAGLLTLAVPSSTIEIYALDAPGAFVNAVDTEAELDHVLGDPRRNGVLIGPGHGVGAETAARVLRILSSDRAVVLDADALTSFQDDYGLLFSAIKRRNAPVVITPHQGEFERLFKHVPAKDGKLARARGAAADSGAVVVLKGADTVVAAPDGRAAIADNAPPWLATGGSGDVLAGIIIGLLVQGMLAWEAACAAVWLHGEAGKVAGRGLIAEDLPETLPKVLKSLLSNQSLGAPANRA